MRKMPFVKPLIGWLVRVRQERLFKGSVNYWENRYKKGGNSGRGSYGELAKYKAQVLNEFVEEEKIESVIEFGCGDGNQLLLSKYPHYIGFDVSVSAIKKCIGMFREDKTKSFYLDNSLAFLDNHRLFRADLTLSLDVIYHLVEYEIFEAYLHHLFDASNKYVIIYAWDVDGKRSSHVCHRKFSRWIEENKKDWFLYRINTGIPKYPQSCDFYIYKKISRH